MKAPLVTDAYRRFFNATFDNFEACFEGRPYRIGADTPPPLALCRQKPGRPIWTSPGNGSPSATASLTLITLMSKDFGIFPARRTPYRGVFATLVGCFAPVLDEYVVALRTDMARMPQW